MPFPFREHSSPRASVMGEEFLQCHSAPPLVSRSACTLAYVSGECCYRSDGARGAMGRRPGPRAEETGMEQSRLADIKEIEQLLARYAVGMTKDDIDAV